MTGKVITIANQKGGVGKSTTAHVLVNGLKHLGHTVLAIDLDPQGNLTYAMNVDEPAKSTYDLLTKRTSADQIRIQTEQVDLLPANSNLAGVDLEITKLGKEYRLRNGIEPMRAQYDFIIIDTPPTLSLSTVNALTASDTVIIPTQADIFSLQGLGQLYSTIEAVQEYTNPNLQIGGIVITRNDTRTNIGKTVSNMLEQTALHLNTVVFNARIREAVAVKEAQAHRMDFFLYAPKSNVAKDIKNLIQEILETI